MIKNSPIDTVINKICEYYDIEFYVKSTNGKPVEKKICDTICYYIIVGAMVTDMGGIKKNIDKIGEQ